MVISAWALFAGAMMPAAADAPAAGESIQYTGSAYDLASGEAVYAETHYLDVDAEGRGERVVLYRCPSGPPFARKRVLYRDAGTTPEFDYRDGLTGYREGVTRTGEGLQVYVQKARDPAPRTAPVAAAPDLVIDAGFDRHLRRNWQALERGESVSFAFVLPAALDQYSFKIRRQRVETVGAQRASVIRLSLSGWWGWFLPHIDAVYGGPGGTELLRYEGVSNVRDERGRNHKVRVEFPRSARGPLDPEARAAALAATFVSSCARSAASAASP